MYFIMYLYLNDNGFVVKDFWKKNIIDERGYEFFNFDNIV